MKIGILTFHNAYNYGAVLQAFATQKLLESMGHIPEIINYKNNRIEKAYKSLHFNWRIINRSNIHLLGWMMLKSILQKNKEKKYEKFKNREMNISSILFTQDEDVDARKYDIVMVGSDQIWNPKLTEGLDRVYFGDVIKNQNTRILSWSPSSSYIDYSEKELQQMAFLLSNFSHISVREEGLKKLVETLTNKRVALTLDPTFMINQKIWCDLCHKVKEKNYILVYAVKNRDETMVLAEKIAKRFNKRIIEIKANVRADFHPYSKITCSPESFLSYFYHADYVVSSSFHGTAFSIIFEKQFINFVPKSIKDPRIISLMASLGLASRVANEDYEISNIASKINYEDVKERLDHLRSISMDFLEKAIDE